MGKEAENRHCVYVCVCVCACCMTIQALIFKQDYENSGNGHQLPARYKTKRRLLQRSWAEWVCVLLHNKTCTPTASPPCVSLAPHPEYRGGRFFCCCCSCREIRERAIVSRLTSISSWPPPQLVAAVVPGRAPPQGNAKEVYT